MLSWYSWLIIIVAGSCLFIGVFLWFRNVSLIMQEPKKTMDSAARQLATVRSQEVSNRYDPDLASRIRQSENIYQQAEKLYHQTLYNPKNYLPAVLMGYRPIPPEEYYTLGKRNWVV